MVELVQDFINRRFPSPYASDARWTCGNCYYFSLILKDRFKGSIYYDVIHGHFLTLIDGSFYDATGLVYKLSQEELNLFTNPNSTHIDLKYDITVVEWDKFDRYDIKQKERITKDCLL